jgi:hypothetical protein
MAASPRHAQSILPMASLHNPDGMVIELARRAPVRETAAR